MSDTDEGTDLYWIGCNYHITTPAGVFIGEVSNVGKCEIELINIIQCPIFPSPEKILIGRKHVLFAYYYEGGKCEKES